MFAPLGRRLALLNAVVVLAIIAAVGGSAYGVLRFGIQRQVRQTLVDRAAAAGSNWGTLLATGQPISTPPSTIDGEAASTSEAGEDDQNELVESGDVLLFAFDRGGQLVANPRGLKLAGLPSTEAALAVMSGHSDTRWILLSDGERVLVYTAPVVANAQIVGAVQAIRGKRENDQTLRVVLLAIAISAGLGVLLAAPAGLFLARRAMRPIDSAFDRQRTFVADAAHELRTPLTVLRANAELVQFLPNPSGDEVRAEVAAMVGEIDAMSRLVDDLLALARADVGRLVLLWERVDLAGVVTGAVEAMRVLAEQAGLSLTMESAGPTVAMADAERIRQLMRVLVDNAISYTEAGGKVRVSIGVSDGWVAISVADTGVGIAPEDHSAVFRRFYRADQARARATGGTGLGLSIAQAIVDAHHGQIELRSGSGHGTVVLVRLPMATTSSGRDADARGAGITRSEGRSAGLNVAG